MSPATSRLIQHLGRHYQGAALVLLAIYSAVLIGVELRTDQDFVRNYFTDITGPVPFYAINTSLCTFLLWATAVMFAVCISCSRRAGAPESERWFFWSQILVFVWLGLDERFKFHEWAAGILSTRDEYILAVEGCVAAALFLWLGKDWIRGRAGFLLACAVGFATIMFLVDALGPEKMRLRLTVEDLAKTWAAVFLFAFAWECFTQQLDKVATATPAHGDGAKS